jgi:glycosyltransferase involved in cell wall biosynthesis
MKLLLLTNIVLPTIAKEISLPVTSSGGWIVGIVNQIKQQNDIEIVYCFCLSSKSKKINGKVSNISYYGNPRNKKSIVRYDKSLESSFIEVLKKEEPDVIHVFGTEYPHTLAMVNACEEQGWLNRVVINIQGLCFTIAKHYYASLPANIVNQWTLRDIIRNDNIKKQKDKFIKRGKSEIEALQKVKHVIGRTDLDYACTKQINPNINYHFCNEILRDEFYKHQWNLEKCEKYSIFLSQSGYPIKGLHFMLEALPIIIEKYPDTIVYIAGNDITKDKTLKDKLKLSSYGKYLIKLIKKYSLSEHIVFTGNLSEQEMCQQYLKSHVFVCPSSIENSPNSLGEAMLLGVPCVASDVGGVTSMMTHKKDGFVYQHDAPYILAHYVCEILKNDELALSFSEKARENALKLNKKENNTCALLDVYNKIHGVDRNNVKKHDT